MDLTLDGELSEVISRVQPLCEVDLCLLCYEKNGSSVGPRDNEDGVLRLFSFVMPYCVRVLARFFGCLQGLLCAKNGSSNN